MLDPDPLGMIVGRVVASAVSDLHSVAGLVGAAIAAWLRGHWGIENSWHWVRDVTFDEDRSTVRTGSGPQVMASLGNTAVNLHRLAGATNIAEACRTAALTTTNALDLLAKPQIPSSRAC